MSASKVSIIILNWNGWRDTLECLESVYQIDYPNYDVIVVDNGSTDNSVKKIKEYCAGKIKVKSKFFEYNPYNKPIYVLEYTRSEAEKCVNFRKEKYFSKLPSNRKLRLILNRENLGFAEGNNVGIRYALKISSNYILLLNNDTIVTSKFLSKLINEASNYRNVGIFQPKILNMYHPEVLDSTGHIFKWGRIVDRGHGEVDKGQYDDKLDIIGAKAAACLYKGEMLKKIGLFDSNFVICYEDAELSWRAYKSGWRAKYVPDSIVYHKQGKTITSNRDVCQKVLLLQIKNTVATVKRHGTQTQKLLFSLIWLKTSVESLIGKILKRNTIGLLPYIESLLGLYSK